MTQENQLNEISASGQTITLSNGTILKVKYTMAALAEIEKQHGSVNGLVEKLKTAQNGPIFSTLSHALWAGTNRKMPYDAFMELLEPKRMEEYSNAFAAALQEAFPANEDNLGEAQPAEAGNQ